MKRIESTVLVLLVLYMPLAAAPQSGPLSAYIVPSGRTLQQRYLYTTTPELGFLNLQVILTNVSQKPVTIWAQGSSWSHENMSFEVTRNGVKRHIVREPIGWDSNVPRPFTLLPKEHYVFRVGFHHDGWPRDWLPERFSGQVYTIRAIYRIKPEEPAKEFGVWAGTVSSIPLDFVIN